MANNLIDKLRQPSNPLIARLRGFSVPKMTLSPPLSPTEPNEEIKQEVLDLKKRGVPLNKVRKAIAELKLSSNVLDFARNTYFYIN